MVNLVAGRKQTWYKTCKLTLLYHYLHVQQNYKFAYMYLIILYHCIQICTEFACNVWQTSPAHSKVIVKIQLNKLVYRIYVYKCLYASDTSLVVQLRNLLYRF